jgi:ubiquinone/menaquinone biosynthesis C-methylase UbiE
MALLMDNPLRRWGQKPKRLLKRIGLERGMRVLEIGCGPGFFTIPASELVGEEGMLYALDPDAEMVQILKEKATRKGLRNIETIVAGAEETGLDDDSIALVFMVDTLHHIERKERALQELHRVLKPETAMVILDTHLKAEDIVEMASSQGFSVTGSEKADRFLHMTKLQKR